MLTLGEIRARGRVERSSPSGRRYPLPVGADVRTGVWCIPLYLPAAERPQVCQSRPSGSVPVGGGIAIEDTLNERHAHRNGVN
jgi:hypothetical protein